MADLLYPTFQAPKTGPAPTYQAPDSGPNEYDTAFQDSLNQARSSVQAQLKNAIDEVNRHEGVASQMIGQLPGQYNSLYDLAGNQINQMGAAADAARGKYGMGAGTAQSALTPILGTMAQQRATSQAGVPLLQLGNADLAQTRRGAANQAGDAANAQIDQENRANLSQLSQSARQAALQNAQDSYQSALSQYNNDNQRAMQVAQAQYDAQVGAFNAATQDRQRQQDAATAAASKQTDYEHQLQSQEQDFRNQVALQQLAASNKNNPAMLGPFGADEISQLRGASITGADATRLLSDSAYTKLRAELMKKPPKDQADLAKKISDFKKKNPKANAAAMSLALFNLYGMPQAAPAGG